MAKLIYNNNTVLSQIVENLNISTSKTCLDYHRGGLQHRGHENRPQLWKYSYCKNTKATGNNRHK